LCYSVWGGGLLEQMGAKDFAGGTVVHISSGAAAFAAAAILGKRQHLDDAKPHNIPCTILGGCFLWFGWMGFNGGSALAADSVAALAIATSIIAASGGMVMWVVVERWLDRQATTVGAISGVVAGLVAITPCAGYVNPVGSLAVGVIGALPCMLASRSLQRLSWVDDSLDAFSLHGVGGFVGAILTGLFDVEEGVLYSGQFKLLGVNIIAALAGGLYSAGITAVLFFSMQKVMRVRAHIEQESGGLDAHFHGEAAYRMPTASDDRNKVSSGRSQKSIIATEQNSDRVNQTNSPATSPTDLDVGTDASSAAGCDYNV